MIADTDNQSSDARNASELVSAREREKLRFEIIRRFRELGKYDWSDRELNAEVHRRCQQLAAKREACRQLELNLQPTEQVSRLTRSASCGSTRSRRITLRDRIEAELREAGPRGLTRRELAERLSVEPGTVSSPVHYMVREDGARQPGTRRCSTTGQQVAVLVHRCHCTDEVGR